MRAIRRTAAQVVTVALLGLLMTVGVANAGLFGHSVGVETQFPDLGVVCCGSGEVIAGPGVEFPVGSFPAYNDNAFVDLGDTTIEYGQIAATGYTPANFNGFRFFDALGEIDAIVDVSIDPATNLPGFDASRLFFDEDNVFINLQGLSAAGAHHVVLDLTFAPSQGVPAPGSLALLGVGLGLLGWARRRRSAS